MKKINWKILLILFGITILSVILLLYKIGEQYMWTDEIFSFHAAKMIIANGKPLYDSGLYYARSEIYHYLLALSMKIFGENEFGSRIINIPFLIGTAYLCFFFVRDVLRNIKHRNIYALVAYVLFITLNFSVAMVRETRMYSMETFFLVLAVYSFYKGFISTYSTKLFSSKSFEFRYNIPWLVLFLISFYIAYETQPISILLAGGLLVYLVWRYITKRKKSDLIFSILLILGGMVVVWFKFDTINIYQVFLSLSPAWAEASPKILYYPVLLVRNMPSFAILSPLILYGLFKYRKSVNQYLFIICITYIAFIALQKAQHERYLEPVVPLIVILFSSSLFKIVDNFLKRKSQKNILIFSTLFLIIAIPQGYLLAKELREIDTYTNSSLSIHKKMEFNKFFKEFPSNELDGYLLIADYQSAFTLVEKGYKVDYIIISEARAKAEGVKKDLYFNIPYLVYGKDFDTKMSETEKKVVVLRDFNTFPDIEKYVNRNPKFSEPRVYY